MTGQQSTRSGDSADAVLARAFFDDPEFVWIAPDPETRSEFLRAYYDIVVDYTRRHGTVDEDAGTGAALWLSPDDPFLDPERVTPPGFSRFREVLSVDSLERARASAGMMERLHRDLVEVRHWYLMALGVIPESQGDGHGGRLISIGLERADGDSLPCYLETNTEANVRFYERRGFAVVGSGRLPEDGPPYWCMRRPPGKSA